MPGLLTHYLFGEQLTNELPEDIVKDIFAYKELFHLGLQGPDIFFYHIPVCLKKDLISIGSRMHKKHTGPFLLSLIEILKKKDNPMLKSYLLGYVGHYTLDYYAHPYIYAQAGLSEKGSKDMTSQEAHVKLESNIDLAIYQYLKNENAPLHGLASFVYVPKLLRAKIAPFLAFGIGSTYQVKINKRDVNKAIIALYLGSKFLHNKRTHYIKSLQFLEKKITGRPIISHLSYHLAAQDDDYLNLSYAPWISPFDTSVTREASFIDLFDQAKFIAQRNIHSIYDYIEGRIKKEELVGVLGNYSMTTGLSMPWNPRSIQNPYKEDWVALLY